MSPIDIIRDIEVELSEPLFRGVPMGPTLNNLCCIDILGDRRANWTFTAGWKNRLRMFKHYFRPAVGHKAASLVSGERILVAWATGNFRGRELMLPVIEELGEERIIIGAFSETLVHVPKQFQSFSWKEAMHFNVAAWRTDYRQCKDAWGKCLRHLGRKHCLPRGFLVRLALHLMIASQYVAGCLELLPRMRPSAILTEFDRSPLWSCLVLSAKRLGIPTFTMVHGVLNEQALGYVPILADKAFCWGEMQRRQFMATGEPSEKLIVAGCPRLTRDLSITPREARVKLGLPFDRPVVTFGATMVNENDRIRMAELFCLAARQLDAVSSVVRLHPSDKIAVYHKIIQRYPNVRFFKNEEATLDEAIAATDVVVVPDSGFGSDALVKGRLAIVLDMTGRSLGHGAELVQHAGCPRVTTADELAEAVRSLLEDGPIRQKCFTAAERYVKDFCELFGRDSAHKIAAEVCKKPQEIRSDSQDRKTIPT